MLLVQSLSTLWTVVIVFMFVLFLVIGAILAVKSIIITKKKPQKVRVRFAPSPTGGLHFGGIRTALYNYFYAKKKKGDFILRIEDTDQKRNNPDSEEYIYKVFDWLGIKFDESPVNPGKYGPYRQSERKDIYEKYAFDLVKKGLAYIAFDTQEELQAKQREISKWDYNSITRQLMKNSLTLSKETVKKLLKESNDYVIRLKLPENNIDILSYDYLRGKIVHSSKNLYDIVLWKKSTELPTYHFASVVDDHLMKISHVIRGEEWISSMPYHVYLYKILGWKAPIFVHCASMLDPVNGGKISKRNKNEFPVYALKWEETDGYKELGFTPEGFINGLVLNGWNPGGNDEIFTVNQLIDLFSLERLKKSASKFNFGKLQAINRKHIGMKKAKEKEEALLKDKDYLPKQ